MKILALEREMPGATAEQFQRHGKAEARRVWELYQAGTLREIYFRQDEPSAVLILECANVEAAAEVLGTLPMVEAGLIDFDVIPLAPYPGLSRLFTEA